jgi:nitrogen-specific signal transduction histidine kinase
MSLAYQSASYAIEMEPVIDNLPSAIIVVNRDRRVLLANKMAVAFARKSKEEFFGLRGGEAFGCVNSRTVPEGCGFAPACEFCKVRQAVMDTFEARRGHAGIESEMAFVDLGPLPVRVSTNYLRLQDQELVILALEDVSEQKMQEQIRLENARLRVAAEIAAAVCHEMNQPLMAISGMIGLLMMDGDIDDSTQNLMRTVKEQNERLGDITKKLLNLKRYETKSYAGGSRILDIVKSSPGASKA